MGTLRIEFYYATGSAIHPRDPIGRTSLAVTSVATSGGSRPLPPANPFTGPIIARFRSDAPVYVDIDTTAPDPTGTTNFLVMPGEPYEASCSAGDLISAVLATDIAINLAADASSQASTSSVTSA